MFFGYQSNILDILVLLDGSTCVQCSVNISLYCVLKKKSLFQLHLLWLHGAKNDPVTSASWCQQKGRWSLCWDRFPSICAVHHGYKMQPRVPSQTHCLATRPGCGWISPLCSVQAFLNGVVKLWKCSQT